MSQHDVPLGYSETVEDPMNKTHSLLLPTLKNAANPEPSRVGEGGKTDQLHPPPHQRTPSLKEAFGHAHTKNHAYYKATPTNLAGNCKMDEVEEEAREEEKMETIQGEDAGGDEGENDTTLASEVSRLPSPL